ncbi:hypothetical protein G4B88_003033 [Cannabis sativa]|uniref:AB hydrolase-1 domain-containing protein n=1 Tax=Cannabis sativa TaxID=3483 RepID=A0A7J6E4D3_CANSA|nr:hypothetical protein G4B88_003033 [Cannabis sativa]
MEKQSGKLFFQNMVDMVKEIYLERGFDRPGYGESDPDPNRTVKSLALDVENLVDQLGLGSKFYVMGFSMGGQAIWGCLKYISNRYGSASYIINCCPVLNW